jgi:glucose-6-phosphate 1-dehydrogenase
MTDNLPNIKIPEIGGAHAIVIFGITGDLARKKLIPAIYDLFADNLLPDNFSLIGIARRQPDKEKWRAGIRPEKLAGGRWDEFTDRMLFIQSDASETTSYAQLCSVLKKTAGKAHCLNVLYYLAVSPALYPVIAQNLQACKLSSGCRAHGSFARIIIEKPFGTDLASARKLNRILRRCFAEDQIYRIDHYLGKETVQNITTFRFANDVFVPLWDNKGVDHVQITAFEEDGIAERGAYYDATGALKDMVQNHMLELLAHIAMEEPKKFDSNSVRAERIKLLKRLKPLTKLQIRNQTVRGQYSGDAGGENVKRAYRTESNVSPRSETETFAALKLYIDNARWRGVPFYIRTGKRLSTRYTEIAVQFKERSEHLFHGYPGDEPNVVQFRLQPDDSITLRFTVKAPGLTQTVKTVDSTLCYSNAFSAKPSKAYARLILDAINGDQMLFTHTDEVEAQWKFISGISDAWKSSKASPLELYAAGGNGPGQANALIERDGRKWMPYRPGICSPFGA